MKIDWLDLRLLSFTWCTSLICLEWDSTASSLCLYSAASVKVKWDEIWILNIYWLVSLWRPRQHVWMRKWGRRRGGKGNSGTEGGCNLRWRKTYIHGNIPGHVDVGFVFIHPHLSSPQGIALSVVIYVIVVGLLGTLDVGHSGTWQDFHTPSTLPHLDSSKKREILIQSNIYLHGNFFIKLFLNTDRDKRNAGRCLIFTVWVQ